MQHPLVKESPTQTKPIAATDNLMWIGEQPPRKKNE